MRLGKSNVVLALISDYTFGYVRDQILQALDAAMSQRGYVFMVHRYLEAMVGVSVHDPMVSRLPQTTVIEVEALLDQARAGEMQVEYLASKGHRHLGYAYPADTNVRIVAEERLNGSRAACKRLGLPDPVMQVVDREEVGTFNAALDAWFQAGEITAVCAHNDEVASMLCLALSSRGLAAGKDLAVIGIDGIPLSGLGITTVAIDIQQFTGRIVGRVVAALENQLPAISSKPYMQLVQRESA